MIELYRQKMRQTTFIVIYREDKKIYTVEDLEQRRFYLLVYVANKIIL
jgi:hypothetical protein